MPSLNEDVSEGAGEESPLTNEEIMDYCVNTMKESTIKLALRLEMSAEFDIQVHQQYICCIVMAVRCDQPICQVKPKRSDFVRPIQSLLSSSMPRNYRNDTGYVSEQPLGIRATK